MVQINDVFRIKVSEDKMSAEIHCKEVAEVNDALFSLPTIIEFLKENKIVFGVEKKTLDLLVKGLSSGNFPITIAQGKQSQNGEDGKMNLKQDYSSEVLKDDHWNFRDVMRIPTVKNGDILATISLPTDGEDGMNVHGAVLKARQGKPVTVRAGKNVTYHDEELAFYADCEGQLNITKRSIQVEDVYMVNETLSMKNGNLDFNGSIVIQGDVPTGYTVKASGDVKIQGIVEAATVISGGSIYISEGLSGLNKGSLKADKDIYIGYINQGFVESGDSIYVENSITHSDCVAKGHVYCQSGNIIGGSLAVEKSIEAGDIGNRLSTKTTIHIGPQVEDNDKQRELEEKKEKLTTTLEQLEAIGKGLSAPNAKLDPKMRIAMLRQRRSYEQVSNEINMIDEKLDELLAYKKDEDDPHLIVRNHLHPNVIISFGKYKRTINKPRKAVHLKLSSRDIVIHALHN